MRPEYEELLLERGVEQASNATPAGLVFLFVMLILTVALPRKYAFVPLLTTACFIPITEVIRVSELSFPYFRLIVLLGFLRVAWRKEFREFRLVGVDKLFVCWALASLVLRFATDTSFAIAKTELRHSFDALAIYFFLRCVVRDRDDALRSIQALVMLAIPVACLMLTEHLTRRNVLHFFGGVFEYSSVRDGSVRAQAAFRHAILAGTFGATVFPLAFALWRAHTRKRTLAIFGSICAVIITITATSTGALLSCFAAWCALASWYARHWLQALRWLSIMAIAVTAFFISVPLWHISGYLGETFGGSGWHRAEMFDTAIIHFDEWWLAGTDETAHWSLDGRLNGKTGQLDIDNQYLKEGVSGGLPKLVLFIAIILLSFRMLGRRIAIDANGHHRSTFLTWSLGATLFVHCIAFLNVTYFDQSIVFFYWLLAVIAIVGFSKAQAAVPVTSGESWHRTSLPASESISSSGRRHAVTFEDLLNPPQEHRSVAHR